MKFIIKQEYGVTQESTIVWDADAGEALCTFVRGEFESDDDYIITKLKEMGYESEGMQDSEDAIIEEALRAKAKRAGIKSWHIKSIETLTAEIAEKEGE